MLKKNMENIFTNFNNTKLEFDKILTDVSTYAFSKEARAAIISCQPSSQIETVKYGHILLNQLMLFFQTEDNLGIHQIYNYQQQLTDCKKNWVLTETALYEIAYSINLYFTIRSRFNKNQYADLEKIFSIINLADRFYQEILRYIDSRGIISSEASSVLKNIRNRIREQEQLIRKATENFYRNAKNLNYTADDMQVVRDGFSCVAIKSNYKNRLEGIVLDTSSTGQTVFIVPQKVIELHNELIMLQDDEKKEIKRILKYYTDKVREHFDILSQINDDFLRFDILYAKTQYSITRNYHSPEIINDNLIKIYDGRHPLLGPKAVPLDIHLGKNFKILVITGPNTGGKTVVLKTIGLFVLMVQTGIAIPASSSSQFGIFAKVFADIGDEQSIEQSLSTFSAHIKNIITILKNADQNTLILIDEFGAGTDPVEGSALAIGILMTLLTYQSIAVLTTHYSALKHFATQQEGIENASMEFDDENLVPTYKLNIGIPGSSKALEIAKRLGMPSEIIKTAFAHISQDYLDFEKLFHQLKKEKNALENEKTLLKTQLDEINSRELKIVQESDRISQKEIEINQILKSKESDFLKEARKEFESIIKNIKTRNADKETILNGKALFRKIEEKITEKKPVEKPVSVKKFKPGDDVIIISKQIKGTIIANTNNKNEYQVQAGVIKMNFPATDLSKIKKEKKTEGQYSYESKPADLKMTLDLRGCRYEEAEKKLSQFIEQAVLHKISTVKIIHGIGTGALKNCIQTFFAHSSYVLEYNYEKNIDGNATNFGVTVAKLK